MPQAKQRSTASTNDGATVGFEAELWQMADALRGNMDAAEYKHVVLGLIFLKYISDAFEAQHAELEAAEGAGRRPGGPGRVPRREHLLGAAGGALVAPARPSAKQPTIGTARRRRDGRHRARQPVAQGRAAQGLRPPGARQAAARPAHRPDQQHRARRRGRAAPRTCSAASTSTSSSQFASAEGKKGGQFYTPRCVVRVLVEMLAPYKGRVYDPCCGSGGMFVQSEKFIEAHGGKLGDISHLRPGVELHHLAAGEDEPRHPRHRRPDRARRHLPQRPAPRPEGRLRPRQPAVQRQRLARRAAAATTSAGSTACRRRATPTSPGCSTSSTTSRPTGIAGFVLANGSMSSNQSGEGEIRKAIIEADLVDCMVALPGQLFYSTQIPVCLWFLARNKKNGTLPRPPRRDALHRRPQARHAWWTASTAS